VAGLCGATQEKKLGRTIVIVGASHAKRLDKALSELEEKTIFIEAPSFRFLQKDVAAMSEAIQEAVGDEIEDKVLLVNAFDNSYFVAKTEDGHFIPPRQDSSGRYHVDGEISCAPQETAKQMMLNCLPLLKKFAVIPKIVLVPVPRYLYAPCCSDVEHVPNLEDEDHVEKLVGALDSTHKLWRGMLFRERMPNTKVCNTSKIISDKAFWGPDPVHPSPEGYNAMGKFVLRGFSTMLGSLGGGGGSGGGIGGGNTDSTGDDGDRETPAGSKRFLEDDGGLGGIPKRPFWVHRSDEYVTRNDGNRRGGSFGDRGGRGQGGQWWRGKRGFGNGSYGGGGYGGGNYGGGGNRS
jgi:hypothetical protein